MWSGRLCLFGDCVEAEPMGNLHLLGFPSVSPAPPCCVAERLRSPAATSTRSGPRRREGTWAAQDGGRKQSHLDSTRGGGSQNSGP